MTLTPSEVASLTRSLERWEYAEYFFALLVCVACAGEYIADFKDWFTGGVEERKKTLQKRSTLLLVGSLSLELVCLVRTNSLSGRVIGSLTERAEEASAKAGEADRKAKTAMADSSTALTQAKDALDKARAAQNSLGRVETESNKAQTAASNALTLARDARRDADSATTSAASAMSLAQGARQEADSFEKDILDAKTQAASAESHLANALQQAAEATAGLNRIKSPRFLIRIPELTIKLERFIGTEYTFSSVFQDEESIRLLRILGKL